MKEIYTIGRDESCDIVVPDSTNIISRLHATIRIDSRNRLFITDKSSNGTYVNGMKMSSNVEIPVSRKDVVSFAHIYNLDWSLVPKRKNYLLLGGLGGLLAVVVVVVLISVLVPSPAPAPKPAPVPAAPVVPVTKKTTGRVDSVANHDKPKKETNTKVKAPARPVPAPRAVPETKPAPAPKDTVPKKEPKKPEEIYHPNPLY